MVEAPERRREDAAHRPDEPPAGGDPRGRYRLRNPGALGLSRDRAGKSLPFAASCFGSRSRLLEPLLYLQSRKVGSGGRNVAQGRRSECRSDRADGETASRKWIPQQAAQQSSSLFGRRTRARRPGRYSRRGTVIGARVTLRAAVGGLGRKYRPGTCVSRVARGVRRSAATTQMATSARQAVASSNASAAG